MPVSSIQKYLVKKLDLESEAEVFNFTSSISKWLSRICCFDSCYVSGGNIVSGSAGATNTAATKLGRLVVSNGVHG